MGAFLCRHWLSGGVELYEVGPPCSMKMYCQLWLIGPPCLYHAILGGCLETNSAFQEEIMPSSLFWRLLQMIRVCSGTALVTACSLLCSCSGEATCRHKSAPVGIQLPDFGGRPRLQPSHPRFHIAQILGEHFFICLRGSSSLSSRAEHVHLTSSERLVISECIELGATWA